MRLSDVPWEGHSRASHVARDQRPDEWCPARPRSVFGGVLGQQSPEMLKLQMPSSTLFSLQSSAKVCPCWLIAIVSLYKITELSGPFSLKRKEINIKKGYSRTVTLKP